MNQPKQPTDLDLGRAWLERAGAAHDKLSGALDRGYVAAMIGDGYARLAQARAALQAAGLAPVSVRLTSEMPPELVTAVERAQRAAAEARPHDDLNAHGVGSLSEAIALALGDAYAGIEFEDPTFERGTEAVMAVLRERAGADRG